MIEPTIAPISLEQERMWLLARLHGSVPAFHERGGAWLDGDVEPARLREAVAQIVRRHEVLRTTIGERDGRPVQFVSAATELPLRVVALGTDLDPASDRDALAAAAAEAAVPFDLERGPLLRVTLFTLHRRRHLAVVVMHHLISDGDASLELFFAELFAACHELPLPPQGAQYRDHACSQAAPDALARAEAQLGYWAEELAGAPAALAVATDRPRPAVQTFAAGDEARALSGELTRALAGFAAAADTDLDVLLLAGLQAVLHRHTRQDDILVGAPLAGRDDPRFARAIGYFGNPVVYRGRFAGDPPFRAVVRQLHRAVQEGRRHGDVSFKSVVERLAPARDPGRTPLFQVLFHVRPPAAAPREGASFTLTPVDVDLRHVAYDLVVTAQAIAGGDGLALRVEYNRDLFDPAAMAGLLAQWEVLLRGALEHPDAPVSRLPLLRDEERRRVVRALDARDAPAFRGPDRLHARVEAHARRDPAAPALRFAGRSIDYGELDRRSNQVAHLLRRLGVGPDVLVGVCMERSVDMIVAMLAVLKAGGAYVPFDPTHPPQRLAFMLADAGVAVLLAAGDRLGWLPERSVQVVDFAADRARLDAEPEHPVAPLAGEGPDAVAYAMYTSGSTGRPKAAYVTHRNVLNLVVDTDYLQVEPTDRVAQTANASFDAATMEIWAALLHGAELVGVSRETALAPAELARTIADESFDFMVLTPALFAAVAREVPGAFAPLRTLVCGGDILDPEAIRRVLAAGPPRHLINGYGPTEATVCATWYRVTAAPAAGAALPIGRPVARVAVYLLDPHGEPVPPGVCGEICIAGDGVGRGYHRRPELTAERFPRDPFAARPAATMYRTGDLGRLRHDGQLEFHGRIDQQLKIRGFRIELGEIEAALAEQPGVRQAAVLAVEVAGDKRLVAYVAADAEGEALVRALRGALAQRLPEYMVPAEFVLLDALPVTPNGKLDRAALPAPDVRRLTAGREFVAPRSELEQSLADIWRELLGQPQVGVHDDFFALGGHSLHAVQLFSRLRAVFGVEVRFQEFFGRSTVAELAASMRRARSAPNLAGAIARAPRGEPLPLSFGQERLWFMNRLAPQSRAYNCMYPYRLTGALDVAALDRSLRALVERHEILQTTYAEIDGRPVQRVAETSIRLAVTDLQHLAPAEREAEVQAQLDAEAQRLFDLERGPLFRAGLLKLGPDEQVLWLHFHHLTMDGWSTELAFRELAALYASASQGLPADLPALSVQYADFAAWQRARATDEAIAPLLEFWKQALQGAPPLLDLPGDRPRPPVQSFEGAAVTFELPPALTRALRDLGARQGLTLTMTLLAAWAALLHRHARVDDLVIGMPSANRDRVELERTMGFFVNTLAIRVDLAGDPTVAELLGRVRQVCLAAYDHDALPFERLVQELRPARDAGYNPVVQVAFAPQPPAGRTLQLRGLTAQHLAADARKAIFDLSFYSWESAGGVAGIFEYCTDRFERATIERMVGHLTELLVAMAADPARRVSALPMLTDEERRLVAAWSTGAERFATQGPDVDAAATTARDPFAAHHGTDANTQIAPDQFAPHPGNDANTPTAPDRFTPHHGTDANTPTTSDRFATPPGADANAHTASGRFAPHGTDANARIAPDRFAPPAGAVVDDDAHTVRYRSTPPADAFAADATALDLFETQAARSPEAIAVATDARALTYAELDRRANHLAHRLRALGVAAEARVGVCMERSPELVVALLAVWKAGAAYVPLDPEGGAERLAFILADAGAPVLLAGPRVELPGYAGQVLRIPDGLEGPDLSPSRRTDAGPLAHHGALRPTDASHDLSPSRGTGAEPLAHHGALRPTDAGHDLSPLRTAPEPLAHHGALRPTDAGHDLSPLRTAPEPHDRAPRPAPLAVPPPRRIGPESLAYVVYTSGSTGRPKGVLVEHRGLTNLVAWHTRSFAVGPADRATLVASPGFDASVWEIWPYLSVGASLAVPAATLRLSPEELRDWLVRRAITISFQPTAIAEELLRLQWPARCDLRVLLTGGDRLRVRPGPGLPFAVVNNYGPTEATVVTTSGLVPPLAPGEPAREPTLGRPIAGARVHVLDPHGQPVPVGVPGELHIGGRGVARGYLGRPALTAERFVLDPLADPPGARMYRSGDLVRWRDGGELEFLGRLDEQVKIRGVRIEPGEIEAALREHPAVRDVAVIASEDGPAARRLVAYFTRAADGLAPDSDSHAEHVSAWRALYDATYGRERDGVDPSFDIVGWNSSYTGAPYDPAVMRSWRDHTVERLLGFRPARVWEIGCGTGLLLLPLAPACAAYLGTDFSQQALDAIAPALAPALAHVTLQRREAADFTGVAHENFDLVVLNSIAQYFPDEAYLRAVLTGAVRSVAAGGVVFVGDVRSLPLLAAFRTSIERIKSTPDTPAAAVRERVRRAVAGEEELCVDPAWFFAVGDELARVGHVEVWLKRGRGDDEMTRWRYDAVLFVGAAPPTLEPDIRLEWTHLAEHERERGAPAEVADLAALERRLAARDVAALELLGVPNARVADDARAAAALPDSAGETFAELLARTRAPAIEPEALWQLGERHGWTVRITWSQGHGPRAMDVLFEAAADPQRPRAWRRARPTPPSRASLVHAPLRTRPLQDLTPALRRHLAARLHDAMIPAAFVELDALPRTPHGKLDRRALPAPSRPQRQPAPTPRTGDLEATLTAIWRRLLELEEVGLDDPFFDLGGHSLLLAQVRAAIRTQLGRDVPIVELFQHPTIRSLAAHLRGASDEPAPAITSAPAASADAIAIVGMAGRFPGAADVAAFWANLQAGVESITVADEATLRAFGVAATPGLVPASGVLADAFAFDAELFGVSPGDAALMDPQHRVFLECAWAAMEHAGHRPSGHPGRVGVFAGCDAPNYWMERIGFRGGPLASEYYRVAGANMADGLTTRTAYKLGLRGPAITVLSACSTSLVAVHLACRSLLAGECDAALAGGVAIHPPSRLGHVHEEGSLVSPDGHCRPFDADAAGTVNGGGVAVVVLRRLADALEGGDTIHAVIRGSAVGNDGARKVGYTAPGVDGQAETIARALAAAGVDPASVGYVEAHGTGTRLGDPIEVAALTRVFRARTDAVGVTALGSAKGNVGHLGAAAGVTGLIKATLALQHEQVPPTLHFRRPNPELALEQSPFFVNAAPLPWPRGATPRRAGVSAFGVGGTNVHVVLEEAPAQPSSPSSRRCHLLPLSARTEAALAASAERLSLHLQENPAQDLADVAHTLRVGRVAMHHRRVLVTRDGRVTCTAEGTAASHSPPVVFMFPGGGSQQPGMGRELYRSEPVYRAALDRCAAAFQAELGLDLRALLFPAADARAAAAEQLLRPCENLAAIFSTEVALAELLQSWGVRPAAVTGHSLGEYAAAHVAGVLSLAGAAALIAERGRIYEALPADAETLIVRVSEAELTPRLGPGVSLAAVNGPEVCVVSGTRAALRDLEAALVREGREVTRLAIATAAHSALVEPFLARLRERAAALTFAAPQIPLVSNLSGRFMTAEEARDPDYWARHLRGTVRFADGLTTLLADPSRVFIEVGPGVTLTKLAARHPHAGADRLAVAAMAQPGVTDDDAEALLAAVGRLWCVGVELDAAALSTGEPRRRVPLPTYPFARTRHVYAGPRADSGAPTDRRITLDLGKAADEIAIKLRRLRDTARITAEDAALVADLDRVCASQIYAYLFADSERTVFDRGELLAGLGVAPEFTRYADFFLRALAEEGALRRDGDLIELLPAARELAAPADLARRFAARHPDASGLLALAEHCGAHYGPALRGEIDNTAVLHPDGSYALVRPAEELLLRTSHPKLYVRMVRDLVLRAVRSAHGAPLRILEFGGGQGRLTWELAPLLDGLDVEYWFTDISRYFTLEAEKRARDEALAGMRFSRLDLDEDPIHQGYPRGYFDIIVGLDALHVARDLTASVAGLRHILREDGLLIVVEVTRLATWHTALWGLEEGWWSFTDTELRRGSPVLPAADWQALFERQNFRCTRVLPEEESERAATDHVVIAAQAHPIGSEPAATPIEPPAPTRAATGRPATPPRSEHERAIAALWQQALGTPCEDIHANFFALGGDSLIAVGLLTRLRAAFAVRLDSHALLERPTIAQLGEFIDAQRRAAAEPDLAPRPADNLVQLRGGGLSRPLFLVHAVGGHVYSYAELAGRLQLDQAVFGLRAFAADERRAHAGSIESIARAYLERVRAVQPEGPYHIGGWSFGGAVAFEMAAQLRAAGQTVLPLLIDSPAPTYFRDVAAAVEARAFRVFSAELGGAEPGAAETAALEAMPPQERLSALFARIQQSHHAPELVELRQLEELLQVLSDNIRTWCRYEPRHSSGPLLQFRARDPARFLVARERALGGALGWEPFADPVEAWEIPGDHFSIMKGDNVAQLAAAMRPHLTK